MSTKTNQTHKQHELDHAQQILQRFKICKSSLQLCVAWPQNEVKVEGLIDEGSTICVFTFLNFNPRTFNSNLSTGNNHHVRLLFSSNLGSIPVLPCGSFTPFVNSCQNYPSTELIFVTNITYYICGEKIVMFATIYALSCGEKWSPKSTIVEKK